MRVVVDTNIFVSAVLKESSFPADVIRWLDQSGSLLKSAATEAQLLEVLERPYFAARVSPTFREAIRRVFAKAELVPIVNPIVACRDPTDDKFLELAVDGRADLIVTGDHDLLVLNPFRGIGIVTAATFIAWTVRRSANDVT